MGRPRGQRLSPTAWDDILARTGRTLTDVAIQADIPRPTLSALVGGHSRASDTTALRLAEALMVHPATLFPAMSGLFVEVDP